MKHFLISTALLITIYGFILQSCKDDTVTIQDIKPENPNNPYDYYGVWVQESYENASQSQTISNPQLNDSIAALLSNENAHAYLSSKILPNFDETNNLSQLELNIVSENASFFTPGDMNNPKVLKEYIDKTIEAENYTLNSNELDTTQKARVLLALASMKYTAYYFGTSDFNINGEVVQTRQADWCKRWEDCMRAKWEHQFSDFIGWIEFLHDYGAGPGGSVLAASIQCAWNASFR